MKTINLGLEMEIPGLMALEKLCDSKARWHWMALGQLHDMACALDIAQGRPNEANFANFEAALGGFDHFMRMDRHHYSQGIEDLTPQFKAVADWMRAHFETIKIAVPIIEAANAIRGQK